MGLFFTRWRALRLLLALLLSLSLLSAYVYLKSRPSYAFYHEVTRLELQQSQELISQARAHGKQKYVRFRQLQGAGFNNQAQEILLFHHLALSSSRTYVYQPLVWRSRGEHSLVPLAAFLRGATRNTISDAVFDDVCSAGDITHVRLKDGSDSDHLWDYALSVLNAPDKCIVVDDWIFNWNYLASSAIHPIWSSFKRYLAKNFEWSEPVLEIVQRAQKKLSLRSKPHHNDGDAYIALHFRRGDFEGHCHSLAEDHTGFTTWTTLPLLAGSTFPPAFDTSNENSTMEHCYPDISRVVNIIDMHARAKPHIRALYVLHDGAWDHPLVYYQQYQLEAALNSAGQTWPGGPMKRITHSGLLPVHWGEADWAVTVDVELARNAEIFIGNGFSSLSSQVVALRLGADGGRAEDIVML